MCSVTLSEVLNSGCAAVIVAARLRGSIAMTVPAASTDEARTVLAKSIPAFNFIATA